MWTMRNLLLVLLFSFCCSGASIAQDDDFTDTGTIADISEPALFADTITITIAPDGSYQIKIVPKAPAPQPEPTPEPDPVPDPPVGLPHHSMVGMTNLVGNGDLSTAAGWSLEGGTVFDPAVSRSDDGSGSVRIAGSTPAVRAWSPTVEISSSGFYQYGFSAMGDEAPNRYGSQLVHYGPTGQRLFNDAGFPRGDVGTAGVWHEASKVRWIDATATPKLRIQVFGRESPAGGVLWFDDFWIIKLSDPPVARFTDPPAQKVPFNGERFAVDQLGNWYKVDSTGRKPFFPWMMHTDKSRPDYSIYRDNGWNVSLWESVGSGVAKAAQYDMFSMLQLSHYIQDFQPLYNDLATLNQRLDSIISAGNLEHMAGYWWDSEDAYDEIQVPLDVVSAIRAKDAGAPVVVLASNENTESWRAVSGISDTNGAYSSSRPDQRKSTDMATTTQHQVLRDSPQNTKPTSFALIYGARNHPGEMRLGVYNNLLDGARGIAFFGDGVSGLPRLEDAIWLEDSKHFTSEVAALMPLIQQPHWTTRWSASSASPNVRVGTRNLGPNRYLMVVNQMTTPQTAIIRLKGEHGFSTGADLVDYFTGQKVADLGRRGRFQFSIKAIGINQGTRVFQIKEE